MMPPVHSAAAGYIKRNNMEHLYEYLWGWKGFLICACMASSIFWWLLRDMKRQREWRDAKEQKIARLELKIAQKTADSAEDQ